MDMTEACLFTDPQQIMMLKLASELTGQDLVKDPCTDELLVEGDDAEGVRLYKGDDAAIEKGAVTLGTRMLNRIKISSENVDRMGDIIRQNGWMLKHYNKNPVVLWAHSYREPPIARSEKIWTKGLYTFATALFDSAEFAVNILRMYSERMMNATSVGFRPLKYKAMYDDKDRFVGFDFIENDLLEWSAVPVPANADATMAFGESLLETMPKEMRDESPFRVFPDTYSFIHYMTSIAPLPPEIIALEVKEDGDESAQLSELVQRVTLQDLKQWIATMHARLKP